MGMTVTVLLSLAALSTVHLEAKTNESFASKMTESQHEPSATADSGSESRKDPGVVPKVAFDPNAAKILFDFQIIRVPMRVEAEDKSLANALEEGVKLLMMVDRRRIERLWAMRFENENIKGIRPILMAKEGQRVRLPIGKSALYFQL